MNSIYPELFINILFFLDIKSIINFDNSLLNKDIRDDYLKSLKILWSIKPFYVVNKWTFSRELTYYNETVSIKNIKYISNICKNLIIFNKEKVSSLVLYNHNILSLHIDFGRVNNTYIKNINCSNLEFLRIVYCTDINLENIILNCPKLKKLYFLYCNLKEEQIDFLQKLNNINIKIW